MDDGSNDDTHSVLASYGDSVRHIRIPNSGDLVARNTGLRAARNRLVAFCDSDDLWMADFLAKMSAQWRTTPDLMACYSDFRILRTAFFQTARSSRTRRITSGPALRMTGPDAGVFTQYRGTPALVPTLFPILHDGVPGGILERRWLGRGRQRGQRLCHHDSGRCSGIPGRCPAPDGRDTQTHEQHLGRHGDDEPPGRADCWSTYCTRIPNWHI